MAIQKGITILVISLLLNITYSLFDCKDMTGDTCEEGYYKKRSILKYQCCPCKDNCAECTDGSTCQRCMGGYYMTSDDCYQCPEDCLQCTSSTSCSICNATSQLIAGTCIKCPKNCDQCTTSTSCSKCIDGYVESDGSIPCVGLWLGAVRGNTYL